MIDPQLAGRVALVTGANNPEGIGVATARALAAQGAAVCLHFHRRMGDSRRAGETEAGAGVAPTPDASAPGRVEDDASRPGIGAEPPPPSEARYWALQQRSAETIVAELRAADGRATCFEADLRDAATIPALFDHVEAVLGTVEILVNNAAASDADTFVPSEGEDVGRSAVDGFGMETVDAASIDHVFGVNARGPGAADCRDGPTARRAWRGLGAHRQRQHGRRVGFPDAGLLRREQARARVLRARGGRRARSLRDHGEHRLAGAHPDRAGSAPSSRPTSLAARRSAAPESRRTWPT